MADLSPKAQELVHATRSALKPNDADRERVFQALLPVVGGGTVPSGTDAAAHASTAAKATLVKVSAVLVGLGLAGGGVYLATRSEPPAQPVAPAQVVPTPVPPAPVAEANEGPSSVVPQPPSTEKHAPAPSRSADSLAEEVAILSRAGSELHAGRPAAALKALEEHQRKFPSGVLAQERTAARVQALCALGRTKEARADFARLARTAPNSPHVARARKACGFDSGEE